MDFFNVRNGQLFAEDVAVADLAARFGTPLYIYSLATLRRHFKAFDEALKEHPHLVCFAVKANGSLALLHELATLGAGFDIVSGGELARVIAAGGDPHKVVFSGVGKTRAEITEALRQGIHCFNVESEAELALIAEIAGDLGLRAPVSLRINPDVDARTHPSISTGLKSNKFGIAIEAAEELYVRAAADQRLQVCGLDCHIGSQMTSTGPMLEAADRLVALDARLRGRGIAIEHFDSGGGLGVTYIDETPPEPYDFYKALSEAIADHSRTIIIEPGRAMVANAGLMVTEVVRLKSNGERHFCVVDAGMNDLIRPALYDSVMNIVPVQERAGAPQVYEVVGPVCESDDYLGHGRSLCVAPGDLLAVRGAGAYGSSMSSNYNSHPLAPEVLVDGATVHLIRARQSLEQMWELERIPQGGSRAS